MKITDIRTYLAHDGTRNNVFLQVTTDEGVTGVGEPYSIGPDEGILGTIENLKGWFIGQDPSRIEWLLRRAKNTMRFPLGQVAWSALSGIDHALWDIAGKAAGVPVYRLLGGAARDRVRVYHGIHGDTPEKCAENALARQAEGYSAFKMSPYGPGWSEKPWRYVVRHAAERLEAVRKAVGDGPELAVDVHATLRDAFRARELIEAMAPYRLMFVEEPVRPDLIETTARLRRETRVPIATGENLYGVARYSELMAIDGADIIQPDVLCCGGLHELKKICAVAEASYVSVAPHNPLGLLSTALSVHLAASINNFLILEFHSDHESPKARFVDEPWVPEGGYFELPTRPGIGMELDLAAIKGNPTRHWNRGFPRHADGSPAFI
ncbi:MAG: mandelate racemase/muconate lactonizing enzyme family protein [SAR202 cluster bacterium]|nr:mandelate racemase/muconate lactonizing enzyme family protein [SAR202 cluster bacterium]